VQIHVPHLAESRTARLLHWYHDGLNAFEKSCAIGSAVVAALGDSLPEGLDGSADDFAALLEQTQLLAESQRAKLDAGRDRLLEQAACRPRRAAELVAALEAEDASDKLSEWLELAFDAFGVDSEEHSEKAIIISPSDHMQVASFPGLPDEGMTATCDRDTALSREDMTFLSWEHPLVQGAIDLICHGDKGQVSACAVSHRALPPGNLLVEALLVAECPAPRSLNADRYLPQTAIRLLIDARGRERSADIGPLLATAEGVPPKLARQLVRAQQDALIALIERAQQTAEQQLAPLREAALKNMRRELDSELTRLRALAAVNPAVREDEVAHLEDLRTALAEALGELRLQLDAVRLVFTH
jgi:ATP-dependent helicase HepA